MKKFFSIGALTLLSVLCLSVTLSSCDKDDKDKDKKGSNSIVGTWKYYGESEDGSLNNIIEEDGDELEIISFSSNGTGYYENERGKDPYTWSLDGNILTIVWVSDDYVDRIKIKVENNKLYLYGDDDNDGVDIYSRVK